MCSSEPSAQACARLLTLYVACTWPDSPGAWQWVDLRPVSGRKGLLIADASPDSRHDMGGMAARLHAAGCELRVTDTQGQPPDWCLADWQDSAEAFITWAKAHTSDYEPPPAHEPESMPETVEPSPPLEAYAQEAAYARRPKPRLVAIDGNTAIEAQAQGKTAPQPLSEDHLADELVKRHGLDWRYVRLWDKWFKWDGGWVLDETAKIFHLARELCRDAAQWPEAAALTASSKRALGLKRLAGNVRDMAGADPRIAARSDQWDTDPWALGIPGGVIDLRTGERLEAHRAQYITKRTAVAPATGAHPLWNKVLGRATQGESVMSEYLARWAGYMLTGDTREEAFLFVHGPGGSGKSTFVQVLRECMGSYARAVRIETFMSVKHAEHPTEIADLAGARLVSAPETEEGSRWNEGRIKMLTGRDKVKARFIGRDYFEFDPQCKIMIFGNHRPRLHSVGEEMRRRLHMVEFPHTIPAPEQDKGLKDAIRAEYPAILAWMIQGSIAWQRQGLNRPAAVAQSTDEYLASQDTLGAWLDECCDQKPDLRVQVSRAYRSFETWAHERGEFVPSVTTFSEKMQARGFQKLKISTMHFLHLSIKGNQPPP